MFAIDSLSFRENVLPSDAEAVHAIVSASGCFSPQEVELSVELVEERLARGVKSGYHFFFACRGPEVVGYGCYGPIPCTESSFDLYWIAVHPDLKGQGIGKQLMLRIERRMVEMGATQAYIDTSTRPQYAAARGFYQRSGYQVLVELPDFYGTGDGKVVFGRRLKHEKPALVLRRQEENSDAPALAVQDAYIPLAAFVPA